MADVYAATTERGGVFSRTDAIRCGYTAAQIRHRLESGRWRAVRRGVYTDIGDRDDVPLDLRAAACCLAMPGTVVAGRTAAVIHGIDLIGSPGPIYLTRERDHHDGRDVVVRPAALPPEHVTTVGYLPVTSVARTVVDLARQDLRQGVVAADSALHQRLTTPKKIGAVLVDCGGWPGIDSARQAARLADARAESALESISRLFMHEQALPPPLLQQWVGGYRVDFLWDGVVGEADGAVKYDGSNPASLLAEKRRQERLEDMGFIVVRWSWDDIVRRPELTAARIRRALRRAEQLRRIA